MFSASKFPAKLYPSCIRLVKMSDGSLGSGAGKGGGTGGSIRDAGGSFGKMEVAHEEQYFYNKRQEQLHQLKEKVIQRDEFHKEGIKQHEEAILRHKKAIDELKN